MTGRFAAGLLLVAGIAGAAPAQSPGADEGVAIVQRAARTYRGLSGLQADFRQTIDDPTLGKQDSRGVLYQAGNRFAMRFTDPDGEAFVLDGAKMWLYTPSTTPKQVLRYDQPANPVYGVNTIGSFLDIPTDRYRITYLKSETVDGVMTDAVLLEPVTSDAPFKRATVWFARRDNLPRKLQFVEPLLTRTLQLSRVLPNASIPNSRFTFTVPPGVRVIDSKS